MVSLVTFAEGLHELRGDQTHVMAECLKLATDVVGAGAGLLADQAWWNVGQALGELRPGELDAQHDGAALILTDDLVQAISQLGAEVLGPVPTREEALDLLAMARKIDLAVLDINLEDEAVYPVADLLSEQGVPFLFATGYSRALVPTRYQHVPRWEKPFDPKTLAQALPKLLRDR
jgi:CheY-like chemotaxis protein